MKVTWSEQVGGFAEIDAGTGKQHDLHAGYDGGPGVFIDSVTEEETGLVYTAVVPVAPPSGTPRLTVYILAGAATGGTGGLDSAASYLHFAVDANGYPTEIRAPVAQQAMIVPPRADRKAETPSRPGATTRTWSGRRATPSRRGSSSASR